VFQGFLIFVLFTAREKRVRQSWRKLCCKDKTKDKYNKCDSSSDQSKTQANRISIEKTSDDTKSTGLEHNKTKINLDLSTFLIIIIHLLLFFVNEATCTLF
jgi:hypothetical protein